MGQGGLRARVLQRFGLRLPVGDLWVFGYGSLMWNPGFRYAHAAPATVRGFHRAFCIYSMRYRGTQQQPGLVLGLDHGGCCAGMAFRVVEREAEAVLAQLWIREMSNDTYCARFLPVETALGRVAALSFVADRRRRQYARGMNAEAAAQLIARGVGQRGPNIEYLMHTLRHLDELGVHDAHLYEILAAVRCHRGE